MTILIWANVVTAIIAFLLMGLVTIGFAPHLRLRLKDHDANSLMSAFVALTSSLVWVRLLWWSLLRPLAGAWEWLPPGVFTLSGQAINTGFNLWAIAAALAALGALYRSLPLPERDHYNWLTVPFYPRRFSIVWRW